MAPVQQIGTRNTTLRLGGPAHGIVTKTVHKSLPGLLFVCLKLCLEQLFLFTSLFKFTGEIVYYLLYMSLHVTLVLMLKIDPILSQI